MLRLENPIQHYAWGSHTAIARLLGAPTPSKEPDAELWIGAHPSASSLVLPGREPLSSWIERDPEHLLGSAVRARYGSRLPFLLKVLAAESPLSLQAHPNAEQAQAGFDREEAAGIPLTAKERNYKDRNHKPELLCALTPFTALCGFRPVPETIELIRSLAVPSLDSVLRTLTENPDEHGLKRVVSELLEAPSAQRAEMARDTLERCRELARVTGPFQREFAWGKRIGGLYPGDVGIVCALLLNLLELEPGEAIYLSAGHLHAYLHGVGIEILANSDNVLRGGLTPKHIAPAELVRVLNFNAAPVVVLRGREEGAARIYETPATEFELQSFEIAAPTAAPMTDRRGPEILLCEHGELTVHANSGAISLGSGQSLFVPADEPAYRVTGTGRLFRASVGA